MAGRVSRLGFFGGGRFTRKAHSSSRDVLAGGDVPTAGPASDAAAYFQSAPGPALHPSPRAPLSPPLPALLQTRDEVRVLSAMAHPNIVLYHDCFAEGGRTYIIMEFCEVGGTE